MKNILSLILFQLIFSIGVNAQIKSLEEKSIGKIQYNVYYKDINNTLNKYIGTWEYSSPTKYFKIRFFKVENVQSCAVDAIYYFQDELRTFVQYKELENGIWIVKYNTFPLGMQPATNALPSCSYEGTHGNGIISSNILGMTYLEPTSSCYRTKRAFLMLKYINSQQLEWKYDTKYSGTGIPPNTPCEGGGTVDSSDLIIPNTMVLTKVL